MNIKVFCDANNEYLLTTKICFLPDWVDIKVSDARLESELDGSSFPLYNCLRAWTASSCDSAITMIILIDSKMPWYICDNISSRIIMLFHLDIDVFMVVWWNDRIDLKKHFTPRVHYTTQTPYKHFQLYLDFSRWWGWPGQSRHKMCVWTSWVLYVPQ